jgi:translation initiation factor RLI1
VPPATKTSAVPTTRAVFANFFAYLDGAFTELKKLEVHYYKPAPIPVTSITATATGRIIKITINNAIGKTSTITITGRSKVTLKPTVAKKILSYAVTKGTKVVVITANGKTLRKTFVIK